MPNWLLLLIACIVAGILWAQPAPALSIRLDVELATERQKLAAAYLAGSETGEGSFVYEFDFVAAKASGADNIVRQAGAGFALALYLGHTRDPENADRTVRSLRFLEQNSLNFRNGKLIAADGDLAGAGPGATALALLTELFYFETSGDAQFASLREDWIRGLAAAWRPNIGFFRRPGSDEASPYYDGEAWLALAHYHRLFPNQAEVAALLEEVDNLFLTKYVLNPSVAFTHWGLMAAAIRHQTTGADVFLDYSASLSDILLSKLQPTISPNSNSCYVVEGLTAAAAELEGNPAYDALLARMAARIDAELSKSLQFQILPEQTQVYLGPGRFLYDEGLLQHTGAFLNGRFVLKTRIDFTQHCLSALIGYEIWQKTRSRLSPPG